MRPSRIFASVHIKCQTKCMLYGTKIHVSCTRYKNNNNMNFSSSLFLFVFFFFSFFTFQLYRFHMVSPFYTLRHITIFFLIILRTLAVQIYSHNFTFIFDSLGQLFSWLILDCVCVYANEVGKIHFIQSILFTMRSHLGLKSTISPYAWNLNGQICLNARHRYIDSLFVSRSILNCVLVSIFLVKVCANVLICLFRFSTLKCGYTSWTINKMNSVYCFFFFCLQFILYGELHVNLRK